MNAPLNPNKLSNPVLQHALAYAGMGMSVLPVHGVQNGKCTCGKACATPGKHPRTPNGVNGAIGNAYRITSWFLSWPNSNVGIATGAQSKIFVVDVDPRNHGDESLSLLEDKYGKLPSTLTARTGGGGMHFYFRMPAGIKLSGVLGRTGKSYPGIDIQADGKYVLAAPSVTAGPYNWLDCDEMPTASMIAEAPQWLLDLASGRPITALASQPERPSPLPVTTLPAHEVDRIEGALARCFDPADSRERWLHVGMALHSTGAGDQAYGMWCAWSEKSAATTGKYDEKIQQRTWASFRPHKQGITTGTIFKIATDAGWEDPLVVEQANSPLVKNLQASATESQRAASVEPLAPTLPEFRGAPVDLWGKIVAPPARREFFPPVISDYAFEVAEVSGFDPGYVAMAALVACAGALHDGIRIQCKINDPTFLQSARLWNAMVGAPSAKKSPVIKKVTSQLRQIENDLREKYEEDQKKYKADLRKWKAEAKKAEKAGKDYEDCEPAPPSLTRLVVDDTTIERLQMVLAHNPRGIIQVRDELSGWFASMGVYGDRGSAGKDEAHWLELYDGGPRSFDRVGRDDLWVGNWGASVIGGIQPETIRAIVDKLPNNGLLQRFVPIIGHHVPANDRFMDLPKLKGFETIVETLYGYSANEIPITMTQQADIVRKRVFDNLAALMTSLENGSPRLATHLGKWEGLFCRLVLVVHCIGCAQGEQRNLTHPSNTQVSEEPAILAERLMMSYLLPHLMCFYETVLNDGGSARSGPLLDDVRKLGEHLLTKGWTSFTDRDVTQAVKRWRYREVREKAERYATLEAMGWILSNGKLDARGLAKSYSVNPAVHTIFASQGQKFTKAMKVVSDMLNNACVED